MIAAPNVPGKTALVVMCPYCDKPARLVDSIEIYKRRSYGWAWWCEPCDAHVGCHKKTYTPLGRLANRELRHWKQEAHKAFDPLWKSSAMRRADAYKLMQSLMGMTPDEAHIGEFDVEQCQKLIRLLKETQQRANTGKRPEFADLEPANA